MCPNNDIFFDPDQECFDRVRLTTGMDLLIPQLGSDVLQHFWAFRPSDIAKEMTFTGSGFNEIDYAINDYETGLRILYVRLVSLKDIALGKQ